MKTEIKASSLLNAVKWLLSVALVVGAVAGNYLYPDMALLYRVLAVVALLGASAFVALTTCQGQAFLQLLKEANRERRKVVWPTKEETRQTTMVVLVVVAIMAVVLWLVEMGLGAVVKMIIG